MKKKNNIITYYNLYPFPLTVSSIEHIKDLQNKYVFYNTTSDFLNYTNSSDHFLTDPSISAVTVLASEKDTDYKTIIIVLDLDIVKKDLGVLAHESVHYADAMFDTLGMNGEGYDMGDEHYAYLVEWCFNRLFEYVTRK